MRYLTITLLVVCLVSLTALAQPTRQDIAWELAAAYGGSLVGGLVGGLASLPVYLSAFNQMGCFELSADIPDSENPEMSKQEACFVREGESSGERLSKVTLSLVSLGSGAGALGGVALAARAQGHEGNMLAASGGALIGSLASTMITLAALDYATEALSNQDEAELPFHLRIGVIIAPIVTIALIIIGYHYL